MRGIGMKSTIAPEGVVLPKNTFLNTSVHSVSPGYFATMGIPLLKGRDLTPPDAAAKPLPVVVNRAFADFFFPHQNPLGKGFAYGADGTVPPTHTIVGIVANAKYRGMREADPPAFYSPIDEATTAEPHLMLYVRTWGSPSAVAASVRQAGAALGRGVPLSETITLAREVEDSVWQERLVAILSAFFGAASVLLAAIGLYGALARSVAQRSRELGVRLAIGARVRHIVPVVASRMAIAVGCGLVAGFAASAALLRLARALLFGVGPADPVSYAAAAVLVLFCSAAGAAIPLIRALRIDPAATLRSE